MFARINTYLYCLVFAIGLAVCLPTLHAQRDLTTIEQDLAEATQDRERLTLLLEATEAALTAGKYVQVRTYGKELLTLAVSVKDRGTGAIAYTFVGKSYKAERDYERAASSFERAILQLETLWEDKPSLSLATQLAHNYQDLGVCYEQLGDVAKTEENFRKAAIFARTRVRDYALATEAYNLLGDAYRRMEMYDKAKLAFEFSYSEAEKGDLTRQMMEAKRDLEAIEAIIKNQEDKKATEDDLDDLMEDYSEREEALGKAQENLAKANASKQVAISEKKLAELRTAKIEAELERDRQTLQATQAKNQMLEAENQQWIIGGVAGGVLALVIILGTIMRSRARKRANKLLATEKKRSEDLLLEILPVKIANELKSSPDNRVTPVRHHDVTILFTDFKGFSSISEKMDEEDLITRLEYAFRAFDQIMDKYGLEKIKTIGDAYMAAAGLVQEDRYHALNAIAAGLEMQAFMRDWNLDQARRGETPWHLRVGINSGEVVAGVVGSKKFAYDIWGKAVNLAARMESAGEPGKVNVSASTYQLTRNYVRFGPRRTAPVKNIGEVDMYYAEEILAVRA